MTLLLKYTFQEFDVFSSFMAFSDFFLVVKYYFVQEIEELALLLVKNYSLKPWIISFGEGREES